MAQYGNLQRRGITGSSFTTDFAADRSSRSNLNIFSGSSLSVLEEERRLIEKVFSIVDKDNSGTIDMPELKGMFEIFGLETHYLEMATKRIMANVDKEHTGQITPQEFYDMLSQKCEKGDPRHEIDGVFLRMDKKQDGILDIDEIYDVSQMLGENMKKEDIKDMIRNLKTVTGSQTGKDGKIIRQPTPREDGPNTYKIDPNEFYQIMQVDL